MPVVPAAQQSVDNRPVGTPYADPSAPSGAFGATQAKAMVDTGARLEQTAGLLENLQEAQVRIQRKNELVARTLSSDAYDTELNKATNDLLQSGTVANTALTMEQFNGQVAKIRERYLQEHQKQGNSAESMAALNADFAQKTRAYSNQIADASMKAQQGLIQNRLGQRLNVYANQVAANPTLQSVESAIGALDQEAADGSLVVGQVEGQKFRDAARERIVQTAVESLTTNGETGAAADLLKHYGEKGYVGAAQNASLRASIAGKNFEREKYANEGQHKVDVFEQAVGRKATPEERGYIASGNWPSASSMTPVQKIAMLEDVMSKATGQPYKATPEEIRRATIGDATPGVANPYGGSFGPSLKILNELATPYKNGTATPEQRQQFETAYAQVSNPIANPVTQLLEQPPKLPAFMIEAAEQGGMLAPREAGAPAPGQPGSQRRTAPGAPPPEQDGSSPAQTLFSQAIQGNVTGPIAAAGAAVSRAPILGDAISSPQMTSARARIPVLQSMLDDLMQSPFGDSARAFVAKSPAGERGMDLSPSIGDTSRGYVNRLAGLDGGLLDMWRAVNKTIESGTVSAAERKQALDTRNKIENLRAILGIEALPHPKTEKEFLQTVKPGDWYISPKTNTLERRGG